MAEIREMYSSGFFQGEEYLDYERELDALKRNFRARIKELLRLKASGATLFEIGCAYGYFIEVASKYYSVGGCDISGHAVAYAREKRSLNVKEGQYLDFPPPEEPYDIVCMWDTIEHLSDPHLFVEKIARELSPGGILAASTGNIASLNARMRGPKWRLMQSPTHLCFFTDRSIKALFERFGLKVVSIRYPPFWRSADASAYRVFRHYGLGKKIYTALQRAHLLGFFFPLNTFDLMVVYAQKS